ncbi:MAG: DUF2271 domain-containing protein [Oscillospiraceae bacterium]|jgi:hypothetical protein|nr:DUF2271 domain-containing protein [Oscillospiraceae bacterium]
MKKTSIAIFMALLLAGCAGAPDQSTPTPPTGMQTDARRMVISFDYQSQSGHASNQFAVWIEDADGNLVKTLYATAFTANGGYKRRPDSILNWVRQSGLAALSKAEVDAVTGATPKSGNLSYVWDLTDGAGGAAPEGAYTFVVEGTMRWKNYVLYSGAIAIGGESAMITAEPFYHFEADGGNAALTEDSAETDMITNVTAAYIPAK